MVLVATQVKRRRGTTAENDAFTGAEGEITVDLGNKELRVHAGDNKAGGYGVARKDFKNLTDEAKNIGNWSSNVSNCITEIPQDIKLELNNGTLTLKAGSKVYMPNGAGVFDVVSITTDKTTTSSVNGKWIYLINESGNLQRWNLSDCFSGTTAPTSVHYPMWYDTTNNAIKTSDDYGSTWSGKFSFPIAIVTISNDVISSIDQVFNGFGYIGSTGFLLPNVKVLIPNGRNTDGSLKTSLYTTNAVKIRVTNPSYTGDFDYTINTNLALDGRIPDRYHYDEQINHFLDNNSGNKVFFATIARAHMTQGNIDSFTPKTTFHAVDYNDTEYMAHNAMPSDTAVDLTLGASGATYTAPADGYVNFARDSTGSGQNVSIYTGVNIGVFSTGSGQTLRIYAPVKKGFKFSVSYSASTTAKYLKFVYAEGSK